MGLPRRSIYSASLNTHAIGQFGGGSEGFILTVKGFALDTISTLEEPTWNGIIPRAWIKVLMDIAEKRGEETRGDADMSSSYVPEWSYIADLFWRTLVADRGPDGTPPPGWYRRACEEVSRRNDDGEYYDWDTVAMIENPIGGGSSSTIAAFLQRVQSVTWNRRLALTRHRSAGIVPVNIKQGDSVYIIFGCSVPVILRKHEDDYFDFIGECYLNSVEGVMDGLDRIKEAKYAVRDFNLK